jgi:acid phosphatase
MFVMLSTVGTVAAECPAVPEAHIPPPSLPLNIDKIKEELRKYHDSEYNRDLAAAYATARSYVERRAGQVNKPAVVLDIDETTLSNWPNINADDFGFIANGRCDALPAGPCGFNAWILKSSAKAIPPALEFFNSVKSEGVAIIFITARRDSQRQATLRNLRRAGYKGWTKLILRRDKDNFPTAGAYKTAARAKLAANDKFTIIANIGDQQSDLEGGQAECSFKLPNPFYFIK